MMGIFVRCASETVLVHRGSLFKWSGTINGGSSIIVQHLGISCTGLWTQVEVQVIFLGNGGIVGCCGSVDSRRMKYLKFSTAGKSNRNA